MIQIPLFENEKEEGTIAKKIRRGPGPLVKKQMVIPHTDNREIPLLEEAKRLFSATRNRMYIPESSIRELQDISKRLVGALEKTGRPPESIVRQAEKILEERSNLYAVQAIDFI